jgi:hypothetical protein
MKLTLELSPEPAWPPLSWIARCVPGDQMLSVRHGVQVETRADWFCEAIWDEDFASGAFDQTDVVFGSGGRVRDAHCTFVSSASTVDRLHVLRRAGEVLISNSLPCLLSTAQTSIAPAAENWFELFVSIRQGIDHYRRVVPTASGEQVELVYFRNLRWTGNELIEIDKPAATRDFGSFDAYHGFLVDAVRHLSANLSDPARRRAYEFLGTLSSGYDSSTAAAICREFGLERAVASRQARDAEDSDDGARVAEALGIQILHIDRTAWRQKHRPELPFFAANPRAGEVYLAAAEDQLGGKVLVTGFHGDKMWGKATTALGPDIVRGDMSGLSLTEYRLHVGFIHFPIAFLGVRQIRDVHALSNSSELAPWDVPGDYSRPVCRRIVEEAGAPRHAFGQRKKMASVHFGQGEGLLTDASRIDYHAWLKASWEAGRFPHLPRPPVPGALVVALRQRFWWVRKVADGFSRVLPARARELVSRRIGRLQRELSRQVNVPDFLFPWAVDRLLEAYRPPGAGPTQRTS